MIYILKTSVKSKYEVDYLTRILKERRIDGVWNFDIEDCDKILRFDTKLNNIDIAIQMLKENGFECEELPD